MGDASKDASSTEKSEEWCNMNRFRKMLGKTVASVVGFCLAVSVTGFGTVVQEGDYSLKICGTLPQGCADNSVSLQVFMPGKTQDDLFSASYEEYPSVIAYQGEIECGDDGKYSITVPMSGDSGICQICSRCGDEYRVDNIVYTNPEANRDALAKFNSAASFEETKRILNERQYDLGFWSGLYEKCDSDKVIRFLFNQKNKNRFDENDREGAVTVFNKAVVAAALSESMIDSIFDYSDEIAMATGVISDFYNLKFVSDNIKKRVTGRMSGKVYSDASDFDNALCEAFVLSIIEKPDGYKNITDVVNKFADSIGISKITDSQSNKLAGNSYNSFAELKDAVKKISASDKTGGKSGGGSGGGKSGGTLSPNAGAIIANPAEIENTNSALNTFDDIKSVPWAVEAIESLAKCGIVNGKGNNKFCPDDFVTREEFVKMIVGAFSIPKSDSVPKLSDVKEGMWYYDCINSAYTYGIVNGNGDGTFGIGRNITRQDMARIALNILNYENKTYNAETQFVFSDDAMISDYAKEAVYALYNLNIINGVSDTEFDPKGYATRAQAAKIIYLLSKVQTAERE